MKGSRTWLRNGIYLILITLLLLLGVIGFWPARIPTEEEIAQRGAVAPPEPEFSLVDSSTWRTSYGSPRDWIDQGVDSLITWDMNPWKVEHDWFGQYFDSLRKSKDPDDQAEFRRLIELAKDWQKRLLTRYPELANRYNDVPDERNALKKLVELAKRYRLREDLSNTAAMNFPDEFKKQLFKGKPLDAQAAKTWLDTNRALIEEVRAIGLMPERSTKDCFDFPDYQLTTHVLIPRLSNMLLLDARLAADQGDVQGALKSIQAANGLAGHLVDADAPNLIMTMVGYSQRKSVRDAVLGSILPALPASQVDLTAFENALSPGIEKPAAWAKTIRAEWNLGASDYLLPPLASLSEPMAPRDPDLLVETYTRCMANIVRNNDNLSFSELQNQPEPAMDASHLSLRSRSLIGSVDFSRLRENWEIGQAQAGLTKAAFAILRGETIPNDPIHGRPYIWNPSTRQLLLPTGDPFSGSNKVKPLILPKL